MKPSLGLCFNVVIQLILFVLFLMFFGIPSVEKYLAKGTIVVSSEEETNGIEAPAITIYVLKDTRVANMMNMGWKTSDDTLTSLWSFNLVNHCINIGFMNLETCVSNDTFELADYLKEAYLGLFDHCSKSPFHDTLWIEDMTLTFSGRYYTLKPSQIITRNYSEYFTILCLFLFASRRELFPFEHEPF